jgi:hypothetical protein
MVKVNNKNIEILTLDTEETFLKRVAVSLNSLPQYTKVKYISTFDNLKTDSKLDSISNFLDIVKKTENDLDFLEFYEKVKSEWNIPPRDILSLWLSYNKVLPKNSMYIFSLQQTLSDYEEFKNFSVREFLEKDKESYLSALKNKIKELQKEDENWVKVASKFDKVKETEHTEFELEKVIWQFELANEGSLSLIEIFDNIMPTVDCPFVYFNDYYKFYSTIKTPLSWTSNVVDIINLKLYCKKDYYILTNNYYFIDCFIFIQNEKLILEVKSNKISELSKEEVKERIYSIFQFKTKIIREFDTKLSGIFYFPKNKVDKYVFSDLIMNNDLFSIFMGVDESLKISKQKGGIYVHYLNPSKRYLGPVSASIIDKVADKLDTEINNKSRLIFPYGLDFLRVKITRANTYDSVYDFMSILSKLITVYHKEENQIVSFYQKYIPSFKVIVGKEKEIKNRLKDINPELFLPNYSRICLNKPTIIEEEEAEEWEEKGHNVILFPKTPEEGQQFYYVCEDPEFKYTGLRKNTLQNNYKYPYIPCCFKVDQTIKNASPYREYYFNEKMEEYTAQQRIMISGKFAPFNKFAELPENLKTLFDFDSVEYLRKGVSRGKSSFLECVLEALDENFVLVPEEDRENELIKIRKELSKANLTLCKQEMYDVSLEEIKKLILNPEEYLNPNLYINLLSTYFNCNIYLFNKDNQGQIVIPRNLEGHYRYKPDLTKKTVFIYEHMGNESDRATYPQCELIIRWNRIENIVDYLQNENTTELVDKIFTKFNSFYILNKKNYDIMLPSNLTFIDSQVIDKNGKTRCLKIGNIEILTSPIPPLNVKESAMEFRKPTLQEVNKKLEKLIIITKYTINEKQEVTELQGKLGNVDILIPIIPTTINTGDKPVIDYSNISYEESLLKLFIKNQKLSYYIGENFIYLFSKYVNENNIENLSDKIIEKYVNDKVVIKSKISEKYNLKTDQNLGEGFIYEGSKIAIESQRLLEKLIYNLKRNVVRNRNKVFNYYKHKRMDNYYIDITDFKPYLNQTILYGKDSILKWISSLEQRFVLSDRILPEINTNYFFLNNAISEDIFIAKNFDSLKEAITTLNRWYGIQDIQNYTVYLYFNRKNISLNKVGDERILLKYKYQGKIGYTVLLNLKEN